VAYPNAQGTLITRDAHAALAILKKIVDSAEEKVRKAERESAAAAIGCQKDDDPLETLRDVAAALQSRDFESAVSIVREKIKTAVAWHTQFQN
jgi:hypothetical protein